jgi:hypothetical protein
MPCVKKRQAQKTQVNNTTNTTAPFKNEEDKTSLVLGYPVHESCIFSQKLKTIFRSAKINTKTKFREHNTIRKTFRKKITATNSKKICVIYSPRCKESEKLFVRQTGKDSKVNIKQPKKTCQLNDRPSSILREQPKKTI